MGGVWIGIIIWYYNYYFGMLFFIYIKNKIVCLKIVWGGGELLYFDELIGYFLFLGNNFLK